MKIIHAYGVLASPLDISTCLSDLKTSHSIVTNNLRAASSDVMCSVAQSFWPIILPSIRFVSRYKCRRESQILFICDSLAQLSLCNVRILNPKDIRDNIQKALNHAVENPIPSWKLEIKEPSFDEYVTASTKPSILNHIQTEFYKLTPYDLRKAVQAQVISYLAGTETRKRLMEKLNSSYKLDKVKALIQDPRCTDLRNAVQLYTKTLDVEAVAAQTGCATFEILYLSKSAANTKARL